MLAARIAASESAWDHGGHLHRAAFAGVVTSFKDTAVVRSGTYFYLVVAGNSAGE